MIGGKQLLVFAGIGLSLALIFGSGVWVGRLTAPEGLTLDEARDLYQAEEKRRRKEGADRHGLAGLPRLDALQRYDRTLRLSPAQRRALYPFFAEAGRKMADLPENSRERLEVVEELHQTMAGHLDDKQKRLANEILEKARGKAWE